MRKINLLFQFLFVFAFIVSTTNVSAKVGESSPNYALQLPGGPDGTISNVALPAVNLTSLPVTIEGWVYPIAKNAYGALLYYRGTTNGGVQFDKWTNPNSMRGIDPGGKAAVATENINFNAWNHVAYVVTTSDMTIYVNGVATTNTTDIPTALTFDGGLYIGWDAAAPDRTIQGYFDEIRIWNTARTAQELEENKLSVLNGNETGLVGYWNFDDQATVATDISGHGLDGTINGGTYVESFSRSGADLSSLTVDIGNLTPAFDPSTAAYTLSLPAGSTTVNITATTNDASATIKGAGAIDVSSGSATATIVVSANGSTMTYTIEIIVEDPVEPTTNLIENWDGNGVTGDGSTPDD